MSNDAVKNPQWDFECGQCHRRSMAEAAKDAGWKWVALPRVVWDKSGRPYFTEYEIWVCAKCSDNFPGPEEEWLNQ